MQKSFSVAIFIFGLGMNTPVQAQDKFQHQLPESLPAHIQVQSLTMANMVPDNLPDMPSPSAIVNSVQSIDSNRIIPKTSQLQPVANTDNQQAQAVAVHARAMSATEQAQLRNYAPFMRNLVMSANMMTGGQKTVKAARVMRGGKQVIVLGGP
jgi:hypothetical protein